MPDNASGAKPEPDVDENLARMRAFHARMEEDRRKRLEATTAERAALLALLSAAGVTEVVAEYDGQGDSGNVEELDVRPPGVRATLAGDTVRRLDEFIWSLAYSNHPGFEINEGGFGEFFWRITDDHIDLTHNERMISVETTHHEGI